MANNIKKLAASCIISFLFSSASLASVSDIPKDLQEYIDNAENCEHFAGEMDSGLTDERMNEIMNGIDEYCTKAKDLQNKLKDKYKNDAKKIEIINNYDI
ncbi:hypothetical protein Xmau_04101 [Xenorhabdus mauleonii]|uniref:Uncharacterized protein n=1 Tax=Xenorhabdus mauleonii TaxID=351675 RepID=A0A1I3W8J1_9GAMM|nr:hypothetical protein [Xenorhabdus mauleonii]PHM36738.1 hypothetical protein Xmau_04101 [Xenorhabdus mauleonii]SFK03908.1 hypothetical protein SAMN05421680_1255 [Xenorhabdus mauleonii]